MMNMTRRATKRRGERRGESPRREREVPMKTTTCSLRSRSMMRSILPVAQSNSASSTVVVSTMISRSISTRLTRISRTINSWQASIKGLTLSWQSNMWKKEIKRDLKTNITSSFLRTHLVCTSCVYSTKEEGKKRINILNSSLISAKAVLLRYSQHTPQTMFNLYSCKRDPCSIQCSLGTQKRIGRKVSYNSLQATKPPWFKSGEAFLKGITILSLPMKMLTLISDFFWRKIS